MKAIDISIAAIKHIKRKRYYENERAFVTELYRHLHDENLLSLFPERTLIETEVQKSEKKHYGLTQRPDMVVHIPIEEGVYQYAHEGNFIAYACKVEANEVKAREDFTKLEEMFSILRYPLGIFININGYPDSLLRHYRGDYEDRIHELSIRFAGNKVDVQHSYFENGIVHHR